MIRNKLRTVGAQRFNVALRLSIPIPPKAAAATRHESTCCPQRRTPKPFHYSKWKIGYDYWRICTLAPSPRSIWLVTAQTRASIRSAKRPDERSPMPKSHNLLDCAFSSEKSTGCVLQAHSEFA